MDSLSINLGTELLPSFKCDMALIGRMNCGLSYVSQDLKSNFSPLLLSRGLRRVIVGPLDPCQNIYMQGMR